MAEAWRTEKIRRPRRVVQHFVDYLTSELAERNPGIEFHVGGSWRRGAESIGDIDLVVVTPSGEFDDTLFSTGVQLPERVSFQRRGPKVAQGDLELELPKDGDSSFFFERLTMHVDFWCCKPSERGAFLWFITGPKELNVAMRTAAIKRGLSLSQNGLFERVHAGKTEQGKDIWAQGAQVDDGTEEDVARRLGWAWLPPEERDKWSAPRGQAREVQVTSSDGTKTYTVSIDDVGRSRCSCPAFKFRGNCKHQALAAAK
jgi:DNA polymerase/3'-5' exonuclease PolX